MGNALVQYPRDFCLLPCDSNYFAGQEISKLNRGISGKMEGDVKLKKGTSQKRSAKHKQSNARKKVAQHPSVEQIQLRAYFIAERRRQLGLPGDEKADWVQ